MTHKTARKKLNNLREMPGSECSSCDSLWREYRNAMMAHLEAVDELQMAQFMQNERNSLFLEGVVLHAERNREEARLTALVHEKSHGLLMAA